MNIKLTRQQLRAKIQWTCEHRNPEAVSSSCSPVAAEHHGSTKILTVAQHTKTSPSRTPCNPFQGPVMPLNILIFPLMLMRVLMQTTTKNIRTDFPMQLLLICANEVALNQPAAGPAPGQHWLAVVPRGHSSSTSARQPFRCPARAVTNWMLSQSLGKKSHLSALLGLPRSPDRVPAHALCTEQLTAHRFAQVFRVFANNRTTLRLVNGQPWPFTCL